MNKKAYSTLDYMVAFLFFGAAIVIIALMVQSAAVQYGNEDIVDEEFVEKYSKFNEYTAKIESAKDALSSDGGISVIDVGQGIFQASYTFIQLILSTFGLMSEPASSFTQDFDIPFQVAAILITLLTATIIIRLVGRILGIVTYGKP